jgi:hypothetical protein
MPNNSFWIIPETFFGDDNFIISTDRKEGTRTLTCINGKKSIVLSQNISDRKVALVSVISALPETMEKVHKLIHQFNSQLNLEAESASP